MGMCNSRRDYESTYTNSYRHEVKVDTHHRKTITSKNNKRKTQVDNEAAVHLEMLRMKKM